MIIFLSCMGALLALVIIINFIIEGVILCKKNNAIGIIFLFLGLFILGIVIGWALLYNARNGLYNPKKVRLPKKSAATKKNTSSTTKLNIQ